MCVKLAIDIETLSMQVKNLETKLQETEKAKWSLSKLVQQLKASQERQVSDMESLRNW